MDSINTDIIKSEPKEETTKLNSITTCDNSLSIKTDAEVVSNNSNLDLNTDDLNSALSNKNNLSNSVNENLLKGVENTTEYSSSNSIKNDFNKLPELPEIKKECLSPSSNILTGGLNKSNMNNLNNGVVPNIGNMSMPCNNSNIMNGPINNSNINNNNLKPSCKLNTNINNLINTNINNSGANSKNIEPLFESRYSQVQSLVYVFPTQLANEAAEAVAVKRSDSLVAYHAGQEKTKKFIEDNSLKNLPVQKNWNNNMSSNKRNKQSPSLSSSNSQSNNLNNNNSNTSSSPYVYRPPSNSSVVSNASNSYRPGQSPGMTNDLNNWNSPDINMEWPSPQQQTNNFINTGSNLRTSINNNSNLMSNNSGSNQVCYQEQNNINKVNKDNLSREKKLEKIKQLKENLMVSDNQQLPAFPMSSDDGIHRNNWPNDLQEPPFALNQQPMNSNSPFIEDMIGNNIQTNVPNGLNNSNGSNNRRRKANSSNNAQQTGQQQCSNLSHVSPISQPSSSLNSPNPNIAPSPSQQRINNGNSTTPVPVGSNPPPPYSPATSSVSSIRLPPYASPGPPTPSSIDSTILGNNNMMNQNNSSGGQSCKNQFNLTNSPKSVLSSNIPLNPINNQIGIDHNGPISPAAKKCKSLSSTPCMDMNNLDNSVGSDFMNSSLPNNSNMSLMKNGSNPALCKISSLNEPQLIPVPEPQKIQYLPDFEGQELTIQKHPNPSIQVSELGSDLPFLSELASPNSYPLQTSNSNSVIGNSIPNNVQNNSNVNQMNNQNQFNRMPVNSSYNSNHLPIPNQQQMISQPNNSLPPSNMMIETNNVSGGSNQTRFNSNNQYDARMQHSSFNSSNNSNMMNMNNRFEMYGNRMPNQQSINSVQNNSMNQFKNQLINHIGNNEFNSSICPSSHMPLSNINEPPISSNHLQNLQKMALPFDIGIPKIDNNSSLNTPLSQNSFSSNIVNNGPSNSHQFDSSLMTSNNNSSVNSNLSRSNNNPLINNEVNQMNCNQPMPPAMASQNYRIPGPGMISNSQSIGNFPNSNVSSISNINNLGPPNQQIPPISNQYHPNQIEPDSYNLHPGANPSQANLHPLQNSQAPPNNIPNTYINSNVVPSNCNQIIQNNQPIMNGPMGGPNSVGRPSPNTLMMNSMGNSHNANFPPTSNSVSPKLGISQSPVPSQMIMNGNGSLPPNQRMMNASNPINNFPGPMNQHIQGQRVPPMNFNGGPNFSINQKMPPSSGPIQNTNRPPYNSTNVQMNNSKPNTIQYLPSRPLNPSSSHNQRPPAVDFIPRYGNPVDPKMGMQSLQHYPGNGPPIPNNNSIQQGPNMINANLQPPQPPNNNLVNAPGRPNVLLMQRGNNGPQNPNNMINDNSMMSNNMYRNGLGIPENGLHPMNGNPPSMPNAQMSNSIFNKNITPPMMNAQPGDMIMPNNNYGCGPPVNNMSSFNNNTNQFNNNMMVPGQGQPNNGNYNKTFYSPTNDPNYDNSSYHNFQRQLYATNTNNSSGN